MVDPYGDICCGYFQILIYTNNYSYNICRHKVLLHASFIFKLADVPGVTPKNLVRHKYAYPILP